MKDGCAFPVVAPPKLNPPELALVAGFEACPKGFAAGAFEVLPKTEPAALVLDPKGVGAADEVFPNTEFDEFCALPKTLLVLAGCAPNTDAELAG